MAIKKLTFSKEGLVDEREVDKKTSVPKAPPKVAPRSRSAAGTPAAKPARTVKAMRPKDSDAGVTTADGRSVRKIDDLVTKVKCPKCGSERVVKESTERPPCGLCGTTMRLVQ